MKIVAIIPARYESTRFRGKLMKKINDNTIISITYKNVLNSKLFHDVLVVTDSDIIENNILEFGGKVIKSNGNFDTGCDRIASVIKDIDTDFIVNVQGDEPFIDLNSMKIIVNYFTNSSLSYDIVTLKHEIYKISDIYNPNIVKVVVDNQDYAMYFSRSPIPYYNKYNKFSGYYRHIGVYGFSKESLIKFANIQPVFCERYEKLEQLRFLEYGMKIKVLKTMYDGIGIDTPEDLIKAQSLYNKKLYIE